VGPYALVKLLVKGVKMTILHIGSIFEKMKIKIKISAHGFCEECVALVSIANRIHPAYMDSKIIKNIENIKLRILAEKLGQSTSALICVQWKTDLKTLRHGICAWLSKLCKLKILFGNSKLFSI